MRKLLAYILTAAAVISFAMAILTASGSAVAEEPDWAARQDACHEAAELLRELGVGEDDPAILALQEEWWRCQARRFPCFTEEEVVMLAKTIYGEAGAIPSITEQACVGWTVCNHVDEPSLRVDTIREAVITPGRFYGYRANNPVTEELLWLARDILERWNMEKLGCTRPGRVLPAGYILFGGDGTGQHNLFRAYPGGPVWDYSLPSPYES